MSNNVTHRIGVLTPAVNMGSLEKTASAMLLTLDIDRIVDKTAFEQVESLQSKFYIDDNMIYLISYIETDFTLDSFQATKGFSGQIKFDVRFNNSKCTFEDGLTNAIANIE